MVRFDTTTGEDKTADKIALTSITAALMPGGKPLLAETVRYPKVSDLITQHGRSNMMKVLFIMVKEFCSSVNVVRNMNEDQQIEAAAILLDECGNFRLEDYQIMFAMGKRGQFPAIKLMDRVDIQFISAMMDEYWTIRNKAGKAKEQEDNWTPPAQPVSSEKVDQLFSNFNKMIEEQIQTDALKNGQYAENATRKTLDEVLDDLKNILPPPETDTEI